MKKLAYLQCPTGIAGDMCLGALVDAGVPLEYLVEQLQRLGVADEYRLWTEKVQRNGLQATKFHVDLTADQHSAEAAIAAAAGEDPYPTFQGHESFHGSSGGGTAQAGRASRHLPEIEHMIRSAGLPERAATWALAVFRSLAEAEGAVHGIAPEAVHFHEVGAADAIVDIVGTCLGLDWLGVDEIYCSALPTGGGTVRAAHGRLPVPTPAVLKLWESRQVPVYSNGIARELVTPTGAAIAVTLAKQFGPVPPMTLRKVGLGAGSRDLLLPNILQLWLGYEVENSGGTSYVQAQGHTHAHDHSHPHDHSRGHAHDHAHDHAPAEPSAIAPDRVPEPAPAQAPETPQSIVVLETQIDDLSPQAIAYVMERLLEAGALDVYTQAVTMKKSRTGLLLTVICPVALQAACEAIIFRETTTLGIRHRRQERTILQRAFQTVETPYGAIAVKVAWAGEPGHGAIANVQPEYEDCARLARQHQVAWREIHRLALQAWYAAVADFAITPA